MSTEEIKIRPLIRKDRKLLTAMIRKLADKIGTAGLMNIIVSEPAGVPGGDSKPKPKEENVFTRVGIEIVKQLLDILEEDVSAWFADLVGRSPDEFDKLPFDVDMIIIEQLANSEEANSFFMRASRVLNKMKTFAPGLSTKKTA
jgi:hypothetical protein